MKKLTPTPQSLTGSVTVAERIAFLQGQEELMRIDHETLHQQIVDVQESLANPPIALVDMVGFQSAAFAVESEIREARESIRTGLLQAYQDAGAQYAFLYVKDMISTPATSVMQLVSKRSGKHKASTEEAVATILASEWWQEYVGYEKSLLAEHSRITASMAGIAEAHTEAEQWQSTKISQRDSLRAMERTLEESMRENARDLTKWLAFDTAGLGTVVLPPVAETHSVDTAVTQLWCKGGVTNAFLWSQDDQTLLPVTDLVPIQGNERSGIRFITGEGSYAWSVRYANYRRTVSFPRMEVVVVPTPAPHGALIVPSTQLVNVMDTSG